MPIALHAAAPAPPVPPTGTGGLPPALPTEPAPTSPSGSGTAGRESVRLQVAHWMESHFGRAYLPIAMAAGGAVGAGVGLLALGPVGGIAGGLAGAMLGGVLVFAG